MQLYIIGLISFVFGALLGCFVCYFIMKGILKEKTKEYDNIVDVVKNEFTNLANNALIEKQQKLQEQNSTALDDKLNPIVSRIKEFQEKIEQYNETGIKNNAIMLREFENLERNNKAMTDEAQKLTHALTKNQNVKGAFGENLLDTILTKAGMTESVHFDKQFQTKNKNNENIRPDYVIYLPENKSIIIDSKVTLESFIQYQESESEEDLKNFKAATKARIKDLAQKSYETARGLIQPDFILLYVPLENSLSILYQDSDLIENASRNNIIIIGTSSLIATIKLINRLWAQEKRNESVEEIAKAGTSLYETFCVFSDELKKFQGKLKDLNDLFSTLLGRFTRNNQKTPSIFSQVEILKNYGITTNKEIPQEFLIMEDEN